VQEHLEQVMARVLPAVQPSDAILEMGCGDGALAELLSARMQTAVIGVDLIPHPLWQQMPGAHFVVASGAHPPFRAKSFDVVICKDVLHHVEDPVAVVSTLRHLATRSVVILEPNRYSPITYVRMVVLGGHKHFTRRRLRSIVGDGANIETFDSHVWPSSATKLGRKLETAVNKRSALHMLANYNMVVLNTEGARSPTT
jgi:SAM-dependent methyltransferase